MPSTSMLPWLSTSIVASVAGAVSGVHAGLPAMSWAAVLIFAAALVATSLETNRGWWSQNARNPDGSREATVAAAVGNARLLVLAYLWAASTMLCVYRLTGLRWQHGWQYAAAMGLVALLLFGYVVQLVKSDSPLRRPKALLRAAQLSAMHAALAVIGLGFLVLSGKMTSAKGDWAANQIFLAGGTAIAAVSLISALTLFKLMKPADRFGLDHRLT